MKTTTLLILLIMTYACANAQMSQEAAFNLGKSTGTESKYQAQSSITQSNIDTKVGNATATPEQSSYWSGNKSSLGPISTAGNARLNECTTTGLSSTDPVQKQHCEAVESMVQYSRNKPTNLIKKDDALLLKGNAIINNPEEIAGIFGGAYSSCNVVTSTKDPSFSMESCNEWTENKDETCTMGREVEVDPDYIYQCKETLKTIRASTCTVERIVQVDTKYNYQCESSPKKKTTSTCSKTLVVNCPPLTDGCDTAGIVPGSTQGDMRVYFGPVGGGTFALEFGTFADNYWYGSRYYGAQYDRTLSFNIRDVNLITRFHIVHAGFDDWLLVKVNGVTVYVGPYGGDRLELVNRCQPSYDDYGYNSCGYSYPQVQYCATCFGRPELSTSWSIGLNIDIRRHLRNGYNSIYTRTIVAGGGESAIRINARMACPIVCSEYWDNQCRSFEERSR